MPIEIGEFVYSGQLRCGQRNSIFGWIEFAPDYGIRMELTGNASGQLAGKDIKFGNPRGEATRRTPEDMPESIDKLADRQIGVIGELALKPGPMDPESGAATQTLHIEWHSQDGHLVAVIDSPVIELSGGDASTDVDKTDAIPDTPGGEEPREIYFSDEEEGFPAGDEGGIDPAAGASLDIEASVDNLESSDLDSDDQDDLASSEEDIEDPFGLFDSGLNQKLARSLGPLHDVDSDESGELTDPHSQYPNWKNIEGLDDKTRAIYEQWDEIFSGAKDEPLPYLFQESLRLPRPDAVKDAEEAWPYVVAILAQLAKLSVALDICEHFDAKLTYRLLIDEILANAKVHPELAASEMVQHYSTSEHCRICQAEYAPPPAPEEDDPEFDGLPGDDLPSE